jgi:alpha-amylase/alpha-mannosidase (GH57 family)
MSSNKYVCVHGHFYQPPRENAWLEEIENQPSAAPFHDWNERINEECYAPNVFARILDDKGRIVDIVNNYSNISFNIGPTLLSWLKAKDPITYQGIQEADRVSQQKYNGHGNAIAQVFSHLILPLATSRDKETQILWGIADFESHFDRKPEGMWLAETAVDSESLHLMAKHGIKYTILAPRQVKSVRKNKDFDEWQEVSADTINSRIPYYVKFDDGLSIAIFFYDGPKSQGVAFDGYLNNGKGFGAKLSEGFTSNERFELNHIATDGESYGHHHRHGEMALSYALHMIEENKLANLTNYGQFLELYPPSLEVKIWENSSWSCSHGIERWRSDCGCNSGKGYHQLWRKPLRDALDWLRETLEDLFEIRGKKFFPDPWAARNNYISVIHECNEKNQIIFLEKNAKPGLSEEDKVSALRLMEMQRQAILMYTSCGWFFDEISGIETVQILQYACRAMDYARYIFGEELEPEFIKKLEQAPSNVFKNGAEVYQKLVMPMKADLTRVGMHYAVSSLWQKYPSKFTIYHYQCKTEYYQRLDSEPHKLAIGRTYVKSLVTGADKEFSFAVLYLGGLDITGIISVDMKSESFMEVSAKILEAFKEHNLGHVIAQMNACFPGERFTFDELFQDEKLSIMRKITGLSMQSAERDFRRVYEKQYSLMVSLEKNKIPVPNSFLASAQFVLNYDLQKVFDQEKVDASELKNIWEELEHWKISISNPDQLALAANDRVVATMKKIFTGDLDFEQLNNLIDIIKQLQKMGIDLDTWQLQNSYFKSFEGFLNKKLNYTSEEWYSRFIELGDLLHINTKESLIEVDLEKEKT